MVMALVRCHHERNGDRSHGRRSEEKSAWNIRMSSSKSGLVNFDIFFVLFLLHYINNYQNSIQHVPQSRPGRH